MVLLISRVNMDTIRVLGRWRIYIILCSLHTSAQTFLSGMTACMVYHRYHALIPPAHGGGSPSSTFWDSPRPTLGSVGGPGKLLVGPRRLNTPFTHHHSISIDSSTISSIIMRSK